MHSVGQLVVQEEMDELLLELGLAAQQVALLKDGERDMAQTERLSIKSEVPDVTTSAPSPASPTPVPALTPAPAQIVAPAPAPVRAPAPIPAPAPMPNPAPAPMPAVRPAVRVSPASSSASGSPRPTKIKKEKSTVRVHYNRGR